MISKLTHAILYVLDQASARDFYVNALGFSIHTDVKMGHDQRWLTVTPPEQPDLEITLLPVAEGPIFNKQSVEPMRELVRNGTFGFAAFKCKDIYATYEEMKAKGVRFKQEPKKEFYGISAVFYDDSGNFFSLSQAD